MTRRVVLIACCKEKLDHAAPARDLYRSALFRKSLSWAERQPDVEGIFILSALHGVVERGRILLPYDLTLAELGPRKRGSWAAAVAADLADRGFKLSRSADDRGDERAPDRFVFLAGQHYRRPLGDAMDNVDIPLAGLGIGHQLQFLGK